MEDIYVNVDHFKPVDSRPSANDRGPRSPERRFHGAVVLSLGLLSVFLLAGLIGLRIHSADLSSDKANLIERLQASENKLSSLFKERDLLNASLTEKTKDLDRLGQKKRCPAGWRTFSCECYLLSGGFGSWEKARDDCSDRGAQLVIINSEEEQKFITAMIRKRTWIGLSDRDDEDTWTWADGTPLTVAHWGMLPDNGGGDPQYGEEDCGEMVPGGNWNDLNCSRSLQWICEETA